MKRIIGWMLAALTPLVLVAGLGIAPASANGLDGPGNGPQHLAFVYAQSACILYGQFLASGSGGVYLDTTYFYNPANPNAGIISELGVSYQDSQQLPSNFQTFYGDMSLEAENVYAYAANSFHLDNYDAGLLYTACTWVLAP